jgi:hypothetical protein
MWHVIDELDLTCLNDAAPFKAPKRKSIRKQERIAA